MCYRCDYPSLLADHGIAPTANRIKILEVVGNNNCPLSVQEIFDTIRRNEPINRVTVYRILDILVAGGLLERINAGRGFCYGLGPNDNHRRHPHFYCHKCGTIQCLEPESLHVESHDLQRTFAGRIEKVAVQVEGICRTCLKAGQGPGAGDRDDQ